MARHTLAAGASRFGMKWPRAATSTALGLVTTSASCLTRNNRHRQETLRAIPRPAYSEAGRGTVAWDTQPGHDEHGWGKHRAPPGRAYSEAIPGMGMIGQGGQTAILGPGIEVRQWPTTRGTDSSRVARKERWAAIGTMIRQRPGMRLIVVRQDEWDATRRDGSSLIRLVEKEFGQSFGSVLYGL
jgi:hypothetical protein